ncbi:MAG TPA: 2-oxoacid:acceptor oxidoreductase subunit alpha [Patescibacteria group bacterium]|nr:2-oxoacid:acceptor oxidoreductase subunit alpha [Patescibacteria group bacterium]
MQKKFLWKIGGEAGFGIMTTGVLFSKIASRMGYHVFDYNEYPSLIRGGHNTYEVLISDSQVHASKQEIDLLVCLNKETFTNHRARLSVPSTVIYDEEDFQIEDDGYKKINVPFKKILRETQSPAVMINNIALGASLAMMRWDFEVIAAIIEKNFARKGQQVVEQNKKVAQLGYTHIKNTAATFISSLFPKVEHEKKIVITGNESFCLAAASADCRLYAAYPMTPSSSILTTLASWAQKLGMVVRHAEDEISVINTVLGASWAGVRAAIGTSGGGFALMVESISFAGVAEIPLVIYLGMRPGPATGMPTWTEQGDLLFAVHAGHGEFPKIVLAPGDIDEMAALTMKAFDLADIYQTPVIIIADRFLAESHRSTAHAAFHTLLSSYKPDRGKIQPTADQTNGKYLRYKITEDGISPMLIPGQTGIYYQSNSYEHVEDGHTTEEAATRIEQMNKRGRKIDTYIKNHFTLPTVIGDLKSASFVFVSWGGNKGPIIEAMKTLQEKGIASAYIHFTHLFPLNEVRIKVLFSLPKRYILIENNSHAQLAKLLRQETGIHITERFLKYDGRPFYPEEIVNHVTRDVQRSTKI